MSDSNRTSVRYVKEEQWGVTPDNPTFKEFRCLNETMKPVKETEKDPTIRSDQQVGSIDHLGSGETGSLNAGLTKACDDFIAATLKNDWVTHTGIACTLTAAGQLATFDTDADYNKAAGANYVKVASNTAGNNGRKRVIARDAAAKTLTLAAGSITADDANATVSVNYVRNGTTPPSFTREVGLLDVTKFKRARGERVSSMSMTIEAKKRVLVQFDFMGKDFTPADASAAAAVTAAAVLTTANASKNVGAITDGENPLASSLTKLAMTVNTNMRQRPQIGSLYTADFGFGELAVTGSFSAYFVDTVLMAKFLAHEAVNLRSVIALPSGEVLCVHIPNALLSDDNLDVEGSNQDVMENLQFEAAVHPTLGYTIQIDLV